MDVDNDDEETRLKVEELQGSTQSSVGSEVGMLGSTCVVGDTLPIAGTNYSQKDISGYGYHAMLLPQVTYESTLRKLRDYVWTEACSLFPNAVDAACRRHKPIDGFPEEIRHRQRAAETRSPDYH